MPKITIQVDLSDEDAAQFAGRDVVVAIPATQAEYLAFLEHAGRIQEGLAMFEAALAAMRDPDHPGDMTEGLRRLSSLTGYMRESEKAMEVFFARHAATQVVVARTGEMPPSPKAEGGGDDMRRVTQERAKQGLLDHLDAPKGRAN